MNNLTNNSFDYSITDCSYSQDKLEHHSSSKDINHTTTDNSREDMRHIQHLDITANTFMDQGVGVQSNSKDVVVAVVEEILQQILVVKQITQLTPICKIYKNFMRQFMFTEIIRTNATVA